jgi:hypothetical protein
MADATSYFSKFKALIATPELPLLGPQRRPGTLDEGEMDRKLNDFFAREGVPPDAQPFSRSAALLWHDHLDASHTVSQNIESREGSWLHGIMHRREPDYGNAKYWFRRVGRHEAYSMVAESVAAILQKDGPQLTGLIKNGEWMPLAFIDECERAEQGNDAALASTLQKIQAAEFDVLVEHILSRT